MVSTRRAAVCLGVALLAGPAASAATAAGAPDEVRLSAPEPADGGVTLLARVPDALTGMPLQASDFTARQGDRTLAVSVERALDGPAQLVLALDTSRGARALAAEQSAAADLLRTLPMTLPTVVLPGGTGGTVRDALTRLSALRPGAGGLLDGLGEAPEGRRVAVLLTGCPALQAAVGTAQAALLAPPAQVHVLALDAGCEQAAAGLAVPGGGVSRGDLDAGRLLAGVDAVSREVNGTYRLRLDADPAGEPVQVRAAAAGTEATGVLELPGGRPASAPAASTRRRRLVRRPAHGAGRGRRRAARRAGRRGGAGPAGAGLTPSFRAMPPRHAPGSWP